IRITCGVSGSLSDKIFLFSLFCTYSFTASIIILEHTSSNKIAFCAARSFPRNAKIFDHDSLRWSFSGVKNGWPIKMLCGGGKKYLNSVKKTGFYCLQSIGLPPDLVPKSVIGAGPTILQAYALP
ncbi:MAG: hypothetical protein Q8O55_02635, partial [Dehalococcoidales bacterium]|nr:hypothetical protein [Dehalococcoidales bacterium]